MKIYTGLAPISRPFGFDREPPRTVHEFMEAVVKGEPEQGPWRIVNPTFIVKDWDKSEVKLEVDGKKIEPGKDFRIGYEETPSGHDLILWLRMTSTKPTQFKLIPVLNQG